MARNVTRERKFFAPEVFKKPISGLGQKVCAPLLLGLHAPLGFFSFTPHRYALHQIVIPTIGPYYSRPLRAKQIQGYELPLVSKRSSFSIFSGIISSFASK